MSTGRVYFVLRPDGLLKIGHTINWRLRMRAYRTCEIIGSVDGDLAHERHCHRLFDRYRLPRGRGSKRPELFRVPDSDIARLRAVLQSG